MVLCCYQKVCRGGAGLCLCRDRPTGRLCPPPVLTRKDGRLSSRDQGPESCTDGRRTGTSCPDSGGDCCCCRRCWSLPGTSREACLKDSRLLQPVLSPRGPQTFSASAAMLGQAGCDQRFPLSLRRRNAPYFPGEERGPASNLQQHPPGQVRHAESSGEGSNACDIPPTHGASLLGVGGSS